MNAIQPRGGLPALIPGPLRPRLKLGALMAAAALLVATSTFFVEHARAQEGDAWTAWDDSLADRIECANGFPKATLQTFAYKESGYNAEAWRFEIAYSDKTGSYYQKIRARAYAYCKSRGFNGKPSVDTEIAQRGISWGMFQILGDNLRECGLKKPFMSTLTRSESFEYFAKFFAPIWNKHKNFLLACVEYNGGAAAVTRGRAWYARAKYNPWEYADRMVQIRKEFSR
jgi:hypothetical protein